MSQVQAVDIIAPGAAGLNTEKALTLLPPQWCTAANNAVVARSGRLAARKGWIDQTTTPIAATPLIKVLYEYVSIDGTTTILSTANNLIFKNVTDFTDVANDITSSTAPTADDWQFVTFNNKVLGFQKDHTPIEWAGSGDFTDASYTGTGPDGNCAHSAFGRVWAADADLQTIRVSVLLDDTDYSLANGGATINMRSIWGADTIVAISSIGANLVVFGKNNIVLWEDGSGSSIGMTPTTMHVADTIEGTGCIARDSVVATGEGDLIFLSRHGLQSLGRVIQFKSNPTVVLTKNVRADFLANVATTRSADADMKNVRAVHNPESGIYVINFPTSDKQWVFDTHHPFQDDDGDDVWPVTTWNVGGTINGLLSRLNGDLLFGSAGVVGKYASNLDNASTYLLTFNTGWLDFDELNHRWKFLKEIVATVSIGVGTITWNWEWDFSGTTLTRQQTYTAGAGAEWSVAEYSIGEYSGDVLLQRKVLPAHGEGQFLKLGVTSTINGFDLVLQQMSIAPKIGRMVT